MNNDIISIGLAPEGPPMPVVSNLGPWLFGLMAAITISTAGAILNSEIRRVESKVDAAVATGPPTPRGCSCCLKSNRSNE
jgi:hypothetical protein